MQQNEELGSMRHVIHVRGNLGASTSTDEPPQLAWRQLGQGALSCGLHSTSMRFSTDNLRYQLYAAVCQGTRGVFALGHNPRKGTGRWAFHQHHCIFGRSWDVEAGNLSITTNSSQGVGGFDFVLAIISPRTGHIVELGSPVSILRAEETCMISPYG